MRISPSLSIAAVLALVAPAGFADTAKSQADKEHKIAADYWRAGVMATEKQDYDLAIDRFTEAIRLVPDYVTALVDRGDAYLVKKDYDKAMADFDAAVRINPKDPGGYFGRGRVSYAKKDYERAISAYDEAIRLNPHHADFYNGRGMAYRKQKKYEAAIADYTQAIKLEPKEPGHYYNRGNAYKANKEFEKAIADLNEAVRLDPKDFQARNNLALLLASCPNASLRDGKNAVQHATKACELTDWKDADMLDTLAAAYADTGKFDLAVRWAKKALDLAPDEYKEEIQSHVDLFQSRRPYRSE